MWMSEVEQLGIERGALRAELEATRDDLEATRRELRRIKAELSWWVEQVRRAPRSQWWSEDF